MTEPPPSSNYDPDKGLTNKRRRISLACNSCRSRKSRCDGHRPSCASCLSLGLACVYEPGEPAANALVRRDHVSDLEQRVSAVESHLQRLNDVLRGHLTPCAHADVRTTPSQTHHYDGPGDDEANDNVHNNRERPETCATALEEPQDEDARANGMAMVFVEEESLAFFGESSNPSFTLLLFRAVAAVHRGTTVQPPLTTPADGPLLDIHPVGSLSRVGHGRSFRPAQAMSNSPCTALPSTDEMDSLLNIYFDTAGAVFPFIHEPTMRKTYNECRQNGFTRARRTWLGTLNMMFAMASNLDCDHTASAEKRYQRSDVFYKRANELCGDLSKRVISLEIVHYLLLVVIHCQGTQRSVQAWNFHGLVIRSALALGLQCEPAAGLALDPIQQEYHRRTWLVVYILDKILSVAFGRPSGLPEEHIADTMDLTGSASTLSNSPTPLNTEMNGDFLHVSFRLYQVMERSLTSQYRANLVVNQVDVDELDALKASSELRKALQAWSANLPTHLQLCHADSDIIRQPCSITRLRVIITLRYYNVGILIHKPLLRATLRYLFFTKAGSEGGPRAVTPYLTQLAMAEAHECILAARNTIDLVHAIISTDASSKNNLGVWFYTLYYVFTASLVISSRILWAQHGQDVVDEAATKEAKLLLSKAEDIFHRLDQDNSLIQSCLEYIRRLGRMCGIRSEAAILPPQSSGNQTRGGSHAESGLNGEVASREQALCDDVASAGLNGMSWDEDDQRAFELFTTEMFDPSVFESLRASPVEHHYQMAGHGLL